MGKLCQQCSNITNLRLPDVTSLTAAPARPIFCVSSVLGHQSSLSERGQAREERCRSQLSGGKLFCVFWITAHVSC